MVFADSPLACIRRANAVLESSRAFGRRIDWPRARRASREAVRRSLPSSNSSSARLASTPATMRPAAFDVSMPSRSDRNTIPLSPRSRMVVITSAALRPNRSPARATPSSLSASLTPDCVGARWPHYVLWLSICCARRVNVSRSVTESVGLQWSTPKAWERRSVSFPAALGEELAAPMVAKDRDTLVFADQCSGCWAPPKLR